MQAMSATFGTISSRMRLNLFTHSHAQEPNQPSGSQQPSPLAAAPHPRNGKTFPADEIVWGIVIRNGFDELDDPWYHRGTTQHAYLEGNDNVAICGFRPPQSGPRTRRRSRLGLPTPGEHPMCGMCARMVVAPRPRVPVAVNPVRPAVPVPVTPAGVPLMPAPVPVTPRASVATAVPAGMPPAIVPGAPVAQPPAGPRSTSPWVRRAAGEQNPAPAGMPLAASHDSGLLARGVHADTEE
jgi:hypothetical protein